MAMLDTKGNWVGLVSAIKEQDAKTLRPDWTLKKPTRIQQLLSEIVRADQDRQRAFYSDLAKHPDPEVVKYVLNNLNDDQKKSLGVLYSNRLQQALTSLQTDSQFRTELANTLTDLTKIAGYGDTKGIYKDTITRVCEKLDEPQKKNLVRQSFRLVEERKQKVLELKDKQLNDLVEKYLEAQRKLTLEKTGGKEVEELEKKIMTRAKELGQQDVVAAFIDITKKHCVLVETAKVGFGLEEDLENKKAADKDKQEAEERIREEEGLKKAEKDKSAAELADAVRKTGVTVNDAKVRGEHGMGLAAATKNTGSREKIANATVAQQPESLSSGLLKAREELNKTVVMEKPKQKEQHKPEGYLKEPKASVAKDEHIKDVRIKKKEVLVEAKPKEEPLRKIPRLTPFSNWPIG
ncbi:MAG: hypothetical protein ACD_21C00026G0002 [uncultured bacterium]|nr:MAG: hypothetical protein ACD_21C00026G0002 [uncultured bacterium]